MVLECSKHFSLHHCKSFFNDISYARFYVLPFSKTLLFENSKGYNLLVSGNNRLVLNTNISVETWVHLWSLVTCCLADQSISSQLGLFVMCLLNIFFSMYLIFSISLNQFEGLENAT